MLAMTADDRARQGWIAQQLGHGVDVLARWCAIIVPSRDRHEPIAASGADSVRATRADVDLRGTFERIMLPHLDAGYSLARYVTSDAAAGEDVVQEAFLKAYQSFGTFRGGDARAWILAIVRNTARDWLRRRQIERRRSVDVTQFAGDQDEDGDLAIDTLASEAESVEVMLVRAGDQSRVRAIVAALPDPLREVLVLREVNDLSYREIADTAGIPIGTVMSRLARARDAFAKVWLRLEQKDASR